MIKTVSIAKNPYDERICLFAKDTVDIKTGITVLAGCNGIGKTTLLRMIENNNSKEGIPTLKFNNLTDGGDHARSSAGFHGDFKFLATSVCSSEGENIIMNLSTLAGKIGSFIHNNSDIHELWILLDAVDSGLSIDNIVEFKSFLNRMVIGGNKNRNIYIIISANEYEMCNGEQCMDMCKLEYTTFNTYDEYKNFILNSRKEKDSK